LQKIDRRADTRGVDYIAVTTQLGAEAATASELSLRLEILAAVVSSGAHHLVIDAATRDVVLLTARLQAAEAERLRLTEGRSLEETIAATPVEGRFDLEAATRQVRRSATLVIAAAQGTRACLGSRMGAVEHVLNALDVGTDYDETGRRRLVAVTGGGATA